MSPTLAARLLSASLLAAVCAAASASASNDISASNAEFSPCSCDMTEGGCDAHCCCDKDCPEATVNAWELGGECHSYAIFGATLPYDECIARYSQPILDDLRGGFFIYEKLYRQLLCTQNSAAYVDAAQFDANFLTVDDGSQFRAVQTLENKETQKYSFDQAMPESDYIKDKETTGYQPHEFLRGYSQSTSGANKAYTYEDRLSVSRPGIFGHCLDSYPAKFMENLEIEACVPSQAATVIQDQETCDSLGIDAMSFAVYADGSASSTKIELEAGVSLKFDLNTYKEDTSIAQGTFLTPTYNSGECSCDNVVLEAHYNVYFAPVAETANAFEIKNVVVDVVYGRTESGACTDAKHFQQKTSLHYFELQDGETPASNKAYAH